MSWLLVLPNGTLADVLGGVGTSRGSRRDEEKDSLLAPASIWSKNPGAELELESKVPPDWSMMSPLAATLVVEEVAPVKRL